VRCALLLAAVTACGGPEEESPLPREAGAGAVVTQPAAPAAEAPANRRSGAAAATQTAAPSAAQQTPSAGAAGRPDGEDPHDASAPEGSAAEGQPEPESAQDALAAAEERLGYPPDAAQIEALLAAVRTDDPATGVQASSALVSRGGDRCARALARLAVNPDPVIREAALRGLTQARIRAQDVTKVVREARTDESPAVRAAAVEALGVVGDASDVPALLRELASEDPVLVGAAYASLRRISGTKLPYRAAVWQQWWEEARTTAPQSLTRELDRIEACKDAGAVGLARAAAARAAWSDLAKLKDRLTRWMQGGDPRLHAEAYRLAAECCLGDLAEPIRWNLSFEQDDTARTTGLAALKALGTP
jgi:hypothetical protein